MGSQRYIGKKMISFEEFKNVLLPIGGIIKYSKTDPSFSRWIVVNALGVDIKFEWYCNNMSAYIGNVHIHGFDKIEINGFWPNKFSSSINLIKDGDIIAIIPLRI